MKRNYVILAGGLLVVFLGVTALAAGGHTAAPAPTAIPVSTASPAPSPSSSPTGNSFTDSWRYTESDYQWARACRAEDYRDQPLAVFNDAVVNWRDEEAFHQAEEALKRLRMSLAEDDALYNFVRVTLEASMDQASCLHYRGTCSRWTPSYEDSAQYTHTEDVFGDPVVVFQADAGYMLRYTVRDDSKLTVGQRDDLLSAYQKAVQAFLDGKTEKELMDRPAMRKALAAELTRLDVTLSTDLVSLSDSTLSWYDAHAEGRYDTAEEQ